MWESGVWTSFWCMRISQKEPPPTTRRRRLTRAQIKSREQWKRGDGESFEMEKGGKAKSNKKQARPKNQSIPYAFAYFFFRLSAPSFAFSLVSTRALKSKPASSSSLLPSPVPLNPFPSLSFTLPAATSPHCLRLAQRVQLSLHQAEHHLPNRRHGDERRARHRLLRHG